ncbi:MAG: hypothetical protein LBG52_00805 [Candidatus Peribacteria bacterium]|jgi:hypothetical protein|nr:hypothetical protein [Candidatus Peribacteria bacterium]
MERIGYAILLGAIAILIWAVIMGTEKMVRLIIGNYIIGGTCYAFGESIHYRANQLANTPESSFLGINYQTLANVLHTGQLTFVLVLFIILTILVYTSSTIKVSTIQHPSAEKLYYIALIPLTLLSFIFALSLAVMGQGMETIAIIQQNVSVTFSFVREFIQTMPLRMFAHGVIVLLVSSHIRMQLSFSKKTTTLPEGLGDL